MKTGLVLEGGAMRGLFTAGVLDVMMEQGITFPGAVGVSAGAAFGCNFKSKQIGRALRYNETFCKDKRYCSFRSLFKTGNLYGADFCYRVVPTELDIFDYKTYCENPMDFYVVCTDVETGEPVYKNCVWSEKEWEKENCFEWFRASASMPLVSTIVEMEGRKMLDGGVTDSIPLKFFESIGYEKNVVILTRPEGYKKTKNSLMPFIRVALKKYPKLIEAMEKRHEMYNETLAYIREQEQKGNVLCIRPDVPLPAGHVEHKKEVLRETYNIGRRVAEEKIKEIKEFLR